MTETVFVSGATGFIAQHICKLLLSHGYQVVGSVRSTAKGENLSKLLNTDKFSYEVVENIEPKGAFDEALKKHPEVTYFLHTASPFHFKASDIEEDLLKPALHGTNNALSAIKAYGPQIKKVVVTSSFAAIMGSSDNPVTEKSWNPITWEQAKANQMVGYVGSKKIAEKAAWDFVEKEKPNFTLTTVNPVYVFGPQAFDSEVKEELNTSSEIINSILSLKPDAELPQHDGSFIDVRDVAKAHLIAIEKDVANERLLLSSGKFVTQNLLNIINKDFPALKGKIPVGKPEEAVAEDSSPFDNSRTRELLGFKFFDLEGSVRDSVAQILSARNII